MTLSKKSRSIQSMRENQQRYPKKIIFKNRNKSESKGLKTKGFQIAYK